ncbi:MAG: MFS transporter, partial [Armatimonadetes bacterium]|nr:MFS transporter [Candidatus Hippobium faecium]
MVLIIVLVYLAFISLGLPDSMLGACWPVMHKDLHANIEFAGYVGMIVSCGTVFSSLMANRILHKYGTARAVYTSIFLTVLALVGFALSSNYLSLIFLAVPLGLGAGCIDSVLNNFVSLHLEAKHMNWLHCFWGLGACLGPGAVSVFIEQHNGWRYGYFGVGAVQLCIGLLIFFSAKVFADLDKKSYGEKKKEEIVTNSEAVKIPFMKWNLFCWFCLCGGEIIGIAWTGSYVAIGKAFGP